MGYVDLVGLAVVDLVGCHQADAQMVVASLYQSKKARQKVLASWMQPKRLGTGLIFEGLEATNQPLPPKGGARATWASAVDLARI